MKIKIKAVLFDVGGVLINNTSDIVITEAAELFGVDKSNMKSAIHKILPQWQRNEINEREFWKRVSAELGIEPMPDKIGDLWLRGHKQNVKLDEDVDKLVKRLRAAGYITAILSDTEPPRVKFSKSIGILDGFDPIINSCEVGVIKPAREIFRVALDRLGLPANQVAYTDDNENKMDGARELGMHCHLFKDAEGLEKWLKSLGLEF